MFKRLLPKTTDFFKFFEDHSNLIIKSSKLLNELSVEMTENYFKSMIKQIEDIEKQADVITHQCMEALHKTFITPLDRSDILSLIKNMDDIIDSIYSVSERINSYEVKEIKTEFRELSGIIQQSATDIADCMSLLRDSNNFKMIHNHCINLHSLEDRADFVLRSAISKLFKDEKDPIEVIKWKELFQRLERATDHCDNVANILEKVIIEAS